jgi:RNA polymerase sigma-70 factor (ECF subfamily)
MRSDSSGGSTDRAFAPADLIDAVARGRDRAAFSMLFEHYAPRVKGMLMRMGVAAERAEELAQETLLMVWRKAGYFDAGRAGASTWIFTIARNLRVDGLRRDRRARLFEITEMQEPVAADEPARPDAIMAASESERQIRSALGHLPHDQLRVVELSFFEGKPHADIADVLGIPVGTVKSRLRLAMAKLRAVVGELS